jgi:hypothetical protein
MRILGFLLDIHPPKQDLQARPGLEAALHSQTLGKVRQTESLRLGCEASWREGIGRQLVLGHRPQI